MVNIFHKKLSTSADGQKDVSSERLLKIPEKAIWEVVSSGSFYEYFFDYL